MGTQHFFYKNVTKTDASDNVYVAGATVNSSGNYDILVAKYDDRGTLEWMQQIDGDDHFHDFATAIYINDTGTVYVTGAITNDTTFSFSDIVTLKLDGSDGSVIWQKTFDGTGSLYDCGTDVIVSDSGFVYVTGAGYNALAEKDYITLRYSAVGTLKWSNVYDYQGENDAGVKIASVSGSSVFVLGIGQTSLDTTDYEAITIRLYKQTGVFHSAVVSSGGSSDVYQVNDLARDTDGNFYIAGVADNGVSDDMYLAKLDSNLVFQWEALYDGTDNLDDMANAVGVDLHGNVYMAGFVTATGERKNWLLAQYDSGGSLQWDEEYNDTLDGDDEAMSLEIDANDDVIVTGYDSTALNNFDYYTVKYERPTGTEIWNIREDGNAHKKDKALNMAIDGQGSIIITGESQKLDGSYEYNTVKYIEKDIINPTDFLAEDPSARFLYFENKGQLIKNDSTPASEVRYYTNNTYPNYYFMNDTMSMVFSRADTILATNDTSHRVDMAFVDRLNQSKIYPLEEHDYYLSYFLEQCPDGITQIHGNQKLVIPNLWNKIDLIYFSNKVGFKYYFVVKPGGDPSEIQMQFLGADTTWLNGGTQKLTIGADIGSVVFDQPLYYQIDASNVFVTSSDGYADWDDLSSHTYGFDSDSISYNPNYVLIIQVDVGNSLPSTSAIENLELCTFYGGQTTIHFLM